MEYWYVASGGGSAASPYHAGFLTKRAEQGAKYVGAAGVSAGGLAAQSIAMHETLAEAAAYLSNLALTVKTDDIHKGRFLGKLNAIWKPSWDTAKPMENYLKKVTDGKEIHHRLRLGITALTQAAGEMQDAVEGVPGGVAYFVLDEHYEPQWKAGYATSAFPGVMEPILLDGRWCLDGGIQAVTPLAAAIEAGATHVDVVIAETPWPSHKMTDPNDPGNAIDILLRCLELAIHRLTWVDVRYTQRINQLVEAGHPSVSGKRFIEMNVVAPDSKLSRDGMIFDPAEAAQISLRGYKAAEEILPFGEL